MGWDGGIAVAVARGGGGVGVAGGVGGGGAVAPRGSRVGWTGDLVGWVGVCGVDGEEGGVAGCAA